MNKDENSEIKEIVFSDENYILNNSYIVDSEQYGIRALRIPKMYSVDPSKIKTFEDVIVIINALDIKFADNHERFEEVKHLLQDESEIDS